MHICHVIERIVGGPSTSIRYLALEQIAAGHEVTCIYGRKYISEKDLRRSFPLPIRLIPFDAGREIRPRQDLLALRQLTKILRGLTPDITHLHSSKAGVLGRLACRFLRFPNVYSPRGVSFLRRDVSPKTKALYWAIEALFALVGGPVVACSEGERTALRRLPCKTFMIPNQIDIEEIESLTEGCADTNAAFHIAICGRMEPQKNPELIARLIAVSPSHWTWTWIGDGPLAYVLREIPNLHITGWVDRRTALREIRQADVLLHATAWEGMPHAILEAMALGRPIVTTDVEGNRDLVVNAHTGLVCGENEVELRAALQRLANAPETRRAMGAAGRTRAQTLYAPSVVAPQWTALYEHLIRR